jgi:WD40 repeat protein
MAETLLCGRLGAERSMILSTRIDPTTRDSSGNEPWEADGSANAADGKTILYPSTSSESVEISGVAVLPGGTALSAVESSVRRQPYFQSVAQIGRQTAQALAHAHARGIVHRDIKPSNLLLDTAGIVWITDFGLAKAEDDGLTATGDIVGTLRYMAPERFRGEGDAAADIYALGLTLYELLTLHQAFDATDRLKLIEQIKTHEPIRPRLLDGRISRDLETIVLKAFDKNVKQRYATAQAMAEDLRRYLNDEPILARRASRVERNWRWARRNPTVTALACLLLAMLIATSAGSLLAANYFARLAQREGSAAIAERIARKDSENANIRLKEAQRVLKLRDYANRMNLAQFAFENNDVGRMRNLLAGTRPEKGQPDLRGFEWDYWQRLGNQEQLTFKGHQKSVQRVAFSPDGKRVASGDWNGRVLVWNARTGITQFELHAHSDRVNGLAYSPDGKRLVSAGFDKMVKVWDAATGKPLLSFQAHNHGWATALAISPDGKRFATASISRSIKIWNADDGRLLQQAAQVHAQGVSGVAFSPDGRLIASCGLDGLVKLWDAESLQVVRTFEGHAGGAQCVAFSPDGKTLASGGFDRTVRVWEAATGRLVQTLRAHEGTIYALAYRHDGRRIVSVGADQTLRVWDAATGREVHRFLGHTDLVNSVAYSPDDRRLASSAFDKTVKLWDLQLHPEPLTIEDLGSVTSLAFSPDGKHIIFGGNGRYVGIRDAETGKSEASLDGHTEQIRGVCFSPNGDEFASCAEDGTIRIWDARSLALLHKIMSNSPHAFCISFSPNGRLLASANGGGTVELIDAATGKKVRALKGKVVQDDPGSVLGISFSPDGKRIAAGTSYREVLVWDVESGRTLRTLKGHAGSVRAVAFSPDGRWIASAGDDQSILLWDSTSGQRVKTLKGHSGKIGAVAFSPDGRRLASASDDRTVKLFDVESGEEVMSLKKHGGWVHTLAFSPDGRRLASGGFDRTIRIWNAVPLRTNETLGGGMGQ